jgi:hypothetical protein
MAEMMRANCETIHAVVTNNKGTPVWINYSAGSDAVARILFTTRRNPYETKYE